MGRDKGMMPEGDHTWAELAFQKLAKLGIPVALSVNSGQLAQYSSLFAPEQLVVDDPGLSLKGPLAGLMSVHLRAPSQDLFVLACDLPLMELELLQALSLRQRLGGNAAAYVYATDGEPEPLCGIYTAKGLHRIYECYRLGQLPRHSMKQALGQLRVDYLLVPEDKKSCFQNFNSPRVSGS